MANTNPLPSRTEPSTIQIPRTYLYALGNRFTSEQVDAFATSPIRPSFFYGSLMFPKCISDIMHRADVDSIVRHLTPATLPHYRRHAIKWADFPAIIPSDQPNDAVDGVLMFGLDRAEKSRLHAYEGRLYTVELAEVEIELADESSLTLAADVYVWKGLRDELLEMEDTLWSVEGFLQSRFDDDRFR